MNMTISFGYLELIEVKFSEILQHWMGGGDLSAGVC